jgi:mannitol/fructose-specific phosphotransferase system IIA component (Ntr-type)
MEISGVLDPRCIRLELEARGRKEVIGELVSLVASAGLIPDAEAVRRAVVDREALASTGIGQGVALPHALVEGIDRTLMAVGRSRRGIDFDALDRAPVRLVLLIVGPRGQERSHLALLSHLARVLRDEALRRGLAETESPQELARLLGAAQ